MGEFATLVESQKVTSAALSVAAMAAVPTASGTMLALTNARNRGALRDVVLAIKGGQAGDQTLASGLIWAFHAGLGVPCVIGKINDGSDITINSARGWAQPLRDVAAVFTHIFVTGTLSASTAIVEVTPLEGLT